MSELLEKILSKDNMNTAYKRVCANKGAGGVDAVTVEELGEKTGIVSGTKSGTGSTPPSRSGEWKSLNQTAE